MPRSACDTFNALSDWVSKRERSDRTAELNAICDELGMTCDTLAAGGRCRLVVETDDGRVEQVELHYAQDGGYFGRSLRHYLLTTTSHEAPSKRREWLVQEAPSTSPDMAQPLARAIRSRTSRVGARLSGQ